MTELEKLLAKIEENESFGKNDGDLLRAEIKKRNDEAGDNRKELTELLKLLKENLGVDSKTDITTKVSEFKGNETKYMTDIEYLKNEVEKIKSEKDAEAKEKQKAIDEKIYLENISKIKDVLASKKLEKDDYYIKGLMGDLKKSEEFGLLVGENEKLEDFIQRTLIDEVSTVKNTKDKVEQTKKDTLLTKEEVSKMSFTEYKQNKEAIQKAKASWSE